MEELHSHHTYSRHTGPGPDTPHPPERPAYKPFLPAESHYAAKSCVSHKSTDSKSTKLDSEEDDHHNAPYSVA